MNRSKAVGDFSQYQVKFTYGEKQLAELDNSIFLGLVRQALKAGVENSQATKQTIEKPDKKGAK